MGSQLYRLQLGLYHELKKVSVNMYCNIVYFYFIPNTVDSKSQW